MPPRRGVNIARHVPATARDVASNNPLHAAVSVAHCAQRRRFGDSAIRRDVLRGSHLSPIHADLLSSAGITGTGLPQPLTT
jgi:hypothetical protein